MNDDAFTDRWILFDAIAIDRVGRRVFVHDKTVSLEPKAIAVLGLLASRPGHPFARDDILDAVWGHRHVTSGALNRVVTLIRRAVGEDGQEQRYLQTVHGLGYRLDAPVRFAAERLDFLANDVIAPSAAQLEPAADELSESAHVSVELADPIGNDERSWRMKLPGGVRTLFVALAMVAFAAVAGLLYEKWSAGRTPASNAPTLVVLPLHSAGDDKGDRNFADGLSEELVTQLAGIQGLRLIASTSATRAEGLDPAQLATRLHVTDALQGTLRQEGDQLRINLRLVETPSGRTLWAEDYDRKLADIFAVQHEIARSVGAALTLHMGLAPPGTPATVVDSQVFREYLELRNIFHSQEWERAHKAIPRLRALVAHAPDYAPAHGLLALVLSSNFVPGTENEAMPEAVRALELDPNIVDAHAAIAELAGRNAEWATCMKELRSALAINPADSVLRLIYGMWLSRLGYRKQALEQFEIAWAPDPLNYWTNYNLGTQLDLLGRHEQAKPYLDALPGLEAAPTQFTASARWRNAIWRSNFLLAREIVATMPQSAEWRDAYAAATSAVQYPDRWPAARQAIAAAESTTHRFNYVRLQDPQVNTQSAIADFEQALRNDNPDAKLIWTPEYSALRRDPAFQDFLRRTHIIDHWRINGWPSQCRPDAKEAICD